LKSEIFAEGKCEIRFASEIFGFAEYKIFSFLKKRKYDNF